VRTLWLEKNRRFYGLDAVLLAGDMAEAFKLPQAGGFLVKQVVKDTISDQIGLRGGTRMGLVDGKPVPVGGDIILAVQGITTASNEALDQVLKSLETMKPGDELRVTILRDEKVADLSMKIPGP